MDKKLFILTLIFTFALYGSSFGDITFQSDPIESENANIILDVGEGEMEMEEGLVFEFDPKRELLPLWKVAIQDMVFQNPLTLADGRVATTYDMYKREDGTGYVVASIDPVSDITISRILDSKTRGHEVLAMFRNGSEVVKVKPEDVAIFDLDLKRQVFGKMKYTKVAERTRVFLALDQSGSVAAFLDQIKKAGKKFLREIPLGAECKVVSFHSEVNVLANWTPCKKAAEVLVNIQAGGLTDIWKVLDMAYAPFPISKQGDDPAEVARASVLISDGVNNVSTSTKAAILKAKDKAQDTTFAFFAGDVNTAPLEGIPDYAIHSLKDVKKALNDYFRGVGVFLKGHQAFIVIPPLQKKEESIASAK